MSVAPRHSSPLDPASSDPAGHRTAIVQGQPALDAADPLIIDFRSLDLSTLWLDKSGIERIIPHRHAMLLLEGLIWKSEDASHGVGLLKARPDDFWVQGHFPGKPMLPGVLMVEAGAQLGCLLYNIRQPKPDLVVFLRIDQCVFRRAVEPGEDVVLLCRDVKFNRKMYIQDIQGVVDGQRCFEARISGMIIGPADEVDETPRA